MRQLRIHYRHELRTLTYVTFGEGGSGIVRNLSGKGLGLQSARLFPLQRVRLRLELQSPPLIIEARGQVSWVTLSGRCGVRFVNLPAITNHKINEWIFANLLDEAARQDAHRRSILGISPEPSLLRQESCVEAPSADEASREGPSTENDGPGVSLSQSPSIRLEAGSRKAGIAVIPHRPQSPAPPSQSPQYPAQLDWLSQPLSGRTLVWLVDGLVVVAALLLFALIFLSIAREVPPLPWALGTASMTAIFVASVYRAMFALLGGPSLGARLAKATACTQAPEVKKAS